MHKNLSSIIFIALLLHSGLSVSRAYARTPADGNSKQQVAVRTAVNKLGVGRDARLSVKLRDGKEVKGFIQEIGDEDVVVTDLNTGIATEVAYKDVKQVKGHNLSTGKKVAIGVGIAIAVLVTLVLIGLQRGD